MTVPKYQPQSREYAKQLWEKFKEDAANTAARIGTGYDTKQLTMDEKLAIWNDRALTVEQEWELWRAGELSPEAIGMRVFPKREQLAKSGGNLEPDLWIKAANHYAQEAEKRRRAADPMPGDAQALGAAPERGY